MPRGWVWSRQLLLTREVGWLGPGLREMKASCEGFPPLADAADSDATGLWYCAVRGLVPPTTRTCSNGKHWLDRHHWRDFARTALLCRRLGVPPVWVSPMDLLQPPAASVRVCSRISTSGSSPAADFRIALIGRIPQRLFVQLCSAPRSHDVAQCPDYDALQSLSCVQPTRRAPLVHRSSSTRHVGVVGHERVHHGLPLATWGLGQ